MSRGTKKPKDINAPKKNQSSYFIFSNERRGALQKETGKSVTEISKIISGEWKEMDKEQKQNYEQLAAEQKARYAEEFAAYQKTDNYTKYQQKLQEWTERQKELGRSPGGKGKSMTKGGKKQKLKKPKQPEAMPKRPQSSYFIFSNKRRNELREQYPDQKVTELSKLIASEWKVKSAEEKKMYEDEASEFKEKYQKEMESYKQTDEYKEYMEELAQFKKAQKNADKMDEDEEEQPKISLPRKPKDEHCPKKPLSSYFLYAQSVREQTKAENPNVNITEIAREISKKWKLLSEDEKKPYNEEAARLKAEYTKAIAEYEGSDEQKAYKKKLAEWQEECNARKEKARLKQKKKAEAEKKMKKTSPSRKKIVKKKKSGRSMDEDESGSESESESESSSSESSSSSSGSSSSGSSSSESSSDSDSD